jgi:hypothetical protein
MLFTSFMVVEPKGPTCYGNTKACHWAWFWARFIRFPHSQPVSIRSVVMFFIHIRLSFQVIIWKCLLVEIRKIILHYCKGRGDHTRSWTSNEVTVSVLQLPRTFTQPVMVLGKSFEIVLSSETWYCLLPASCWFLVCRTLQPWRWRWYIPPKCQLTLTGLCRVISQRIELSKS